MKKQKKVLGVRPWLGGGGPAGGCQGGYKPRISYCENAKKVGGGGGGQGEGLGWM